MFLWLRILIHELGHYVMFWVLGYRPRGIWVGRSPSKDEWRIPNPGKRILFPRDKGYSKGGAVFPPDPEGMMLTLHRDAVLVAGSVADFIFLLSGFATMIAGEAAVLTWFAKMILPYVMDFANHFPGHFFVTPMLTIAEVWIRVLMAGGTISAIVISATSARELGMGDLLQLRLVRCSICGEHVPTTEYCDQCGAPLMG